MKSTELLYNEIMNADNLDSYLKNNNEDVTRVSLAAYLQSMLDEHGCSKADIIRRSEMSGSNYVYEVFRSDEKAVSRDKLIALCMGFPLSVEETQKALKLGKVGELYPRDRRDAYILFAVKSGMTVADLNELLYDNELKELVY